MEDLTSITNLEDEIESMVKIKIIGVGNGGGNAVEHMIHCKSQEISFICVNTNAEALASSSADHKILLDKGITCNLEEIHGIIADADMVIIVAGMGGKISTAIAPIIAAASKKKNILTIGVVTKPFSSEGTERMNIALRGIEELCPLVESLIIISNDRLLTLVPETSSMSELLKKSDETIFAAVQGMINPIIRIGLIACDFADVRTVMCEGCMALMGQGAASGENRAIKAAQKAVTSPLFENVPLSHAKAILVHITANENMRIDEFNNVVEFIGKVAHSDDNDPEIVFADSLDESWGDEMRIVIIATGIAMEGNTGLEISNDEKTTEYSSPHIRKIKFGPKEMAEFNRLMTDPNVTGPGTEEELNK